MADSPTISILAAYKLLVKKGEELIERYVQGDPAVTYQDLLDCVRGLRSAQEDMADTMTTEINRFEGKCKISKGSRPSLNREGDRRKNIADLGF